VIVISGLWQTADLWQAIAGLFSGLAVWAQQKAEMSEIDKLTSRLRHPIRYGIRHPLEMIRRSARMR